MQSATTSDGPAEPGDAGHAPAPGGIWAGYADQHHPLGGYAVLTGTFGTVLAGGLAALVAAGHELPDRPAVVDVVLVGVATHKLSRLLARDRVTQFLRAPFTRFQDDAGHGEVDEAARGTGLRRAVGELVVCPACLDQWVAGGFALGLVGAPRVTRLLAGMWSAHAIADGLHLAYAAAQEAS